MVGEILGQIDRLDHIVRDLLAFARPTIPTRRSIDVVEGLWRAWSMVVHAGSPVGGRFVLDVAGPVPVEADPELLQQVWLHLFQNAVEAMPQGGELRVRTVPGPLVQVEICDSGVGISQDHLANVFKPFHTTKTRGTGLGLPISRKIVEEHGGSIRIGPGAAGGTTVVVELPR